MDKVVPHSHNDTDSPKLFAGDALRSAPQEAVTLPTGGSTIDTQARTAINDIVSKLQALGLLK